MKKVHKSKTVPIELKTYFDNNPNDSWETFKNQCQTGYRKVLNKIKQNQSGVCCYCEITFYDEREIRDDFRVEHFHPKSDNNNPDINWNLIWTNLLGCCHGGSDKSVLKGERFIQNKNHRHSDVLKSEKNWDDEILNPLEIPAFPPIFNVSLKGKMSVLKENCIVCNLDVIKAQNCLDSKKLNLNSPILKEWREAVIDNLRDEVNNLFEMTGDFENSVVEVISAHLSKDLNGHYEAFFSTIRSYFKEDAEEYLKKVNYDG